MGALGLVLAPGSIVAGRYRLERLLGEGGMGVVWEARTLDPPGTVALKVLKASGSDEVRRFLREARVAAAMRHPNVVAVHDVAQLEDGRPFIVMEMLSGETLGERLSRVGTLELSELARVLVPVSSALGAAHALGVVHRDLKPDNVFLGRTKGGGLLVRVLDFGIAKLAGHGLLATGSGAMTCTGAMLGTPLYMAPEQVFGERDVDQRADIWALGVIAYEALAGRRPIEGRNVGQIFRAITAGQFARLADLAPGLPAEITGLVDRMLARDRDQRPRDVGEPLAVLARYMGKGPAGHRRRRWWAVSAVAVAATAAATAALIFRMGRDPPVLARAALAARIAGAEIMRGRATPSTAPEAPPIAPGARSPAPAARSSEPAAASRLPGGVHASSPY